MLYLTESHRWEKILDSTVATGGRFAFHFTPDSTFYPIKASIRYQDSSFNTRSQLLFFRNEFQAKNFESAFFLEPGTIEISEDSNSVPTKYGMHARIKAGRENDLLYKNPLSGFGRIGNYTGAKRTERLNSFRQRIRQQPFSYLHLQYIYDNKEEYTEDELRDLLSHFDDEVQASALGNLFRTYFNLRNDADKPYRDIALISTDQRRHSIIDKSASLNMLVFWASWCGPCRQEIPLLKALRAKYPEKSLSLVSISIDEDPKRWKKALDEEKMLWPQFVADSGKVEQIRQTFNFIAIPMVIFTDRQGKEIKRFRGYSKERSAQYEEVIKTSLAL